MKEINAILWSGECHKIKLSVGLLLCDLHPMVYFVVLVVKLLGYLFKVYATSFQIVNAYYYIFFYNTGQENSIVIINAPASQF